jgi:hypothetical protein
VVCADCNLAAARISNNALDGDMTLASKVRGKRRNQGPFTDPHGGAGADASDVVLGDQRFSDQIRHCESIIQKKPPIMQVTRDEIPC